MFKHRKIVVLSEDRISSYECGKSPQVLLTLALLALVSWSCFSAFYYIDTEIKLAGAIDDKEIVKLKYIRAGEKNEELVAVNAELKSKLKESGGRVREMAGIIDNLGMLSEAKGAKVCDMAEGGATPVPVLKGDADPGKTAGDAISRLEERLDNRIEAIRMALAELPETAKQALAKAPRKLKEIVSGTGGPYIPEDVTGENDGAFLSAEYVSAKIAYLAELERNLRHLPLGLPYSGDYRVTGYYGSRKDPFTGKRASHYGQDMDGGHKSDVTAAAGGTVKRAGRYGAYGNIVEITHQDGFSTRYAHLYDVAVKKGQKVRQGDVIGRQGNTGRSTGSHLHYEVRYRNTPVNPKQFLKAARYVF